MKDFNIAKYLKENHLGSHGILGRYVDLHGLKEDKDLGQQEAMPEPYEGDGHPIDGLGGKLNRHMDVSMNEENMEEEMPGPSDKIGHLVSEYESWLKQNNLPEMSADELLYDESIKKTPEQKVYLQKFIERWDNAIEMNEEVTVSSSGVEMEEEVDSAEEGDFDRLYDLGGREIEQGIVSLVDDGFDAKDILDFCRIVINAHASAAAQGKKF